MNFYYYIAGTSQVPQISAQGRGTINVSQISFLNHSQGIESLLFTSDTPTLTADWGNIDYELMTANFKFGSEAELKRIKELRPNSPILVSEFWPGWFDHWFEENHNTLSEADFREILGNIFAANGSVNFYMFHGGTNFGYMNGANILGFNGVETAPGYVPDVTSYDYDAPLTEAGQVTKDKLILQLCSLSTRPSTWQRKR